MHYSRIHQFWALLLVLVVSIWFACDRFEESLNRGLEEEKSYTRHAMEYHRKHPDQRHGDGVLEVWSQADYLAQAVANQHLSGSWAKMSDDLTFVPDHLKRYADKPFCVIQRPGMVRVVWYAGGAEKCSPEATFNTDWWRVRSGDMEFSGRSDYWTYVLRLPPQA